MVRGQQVYASRVAVIETCTVDGLVAEALSLIAGSYQSHDIVVTKSLGELPMVALDRHRVLQVIVNLLSNARDAVAAADRREVTITSGRASGDGAGERFFIRVADNGLGIAPENLARVFGYGFTTKVNGHGFGLHESGNAAHAMGGKLSCVSEGPGKGATFTLELPIDAPRHAE